MAGPLTCLMFYLAIINLHGIEGATATPTTPSSGPITPVIITPSSGSDQEAACSALRQVAEGSSLCTTTSTCNQLHCTVMDLVTTDITVLPCASPPSVSVVTMQNGEVIYSHNFSQSEIVPITIPSTGGIPILHLNVTLSVSPNHDFMTLEVKANPIVGPPTTIIPKTTIPLSRSQCNITVTSTRHSTPDSSPTTPTLPQQHANTCQALQNIARGSADQCSTVESCTALDCNFMGQYHAKLTVKPCNNPPAVGVLIEDFLGDTILDETLVNTRTQPISFGGIPLFDLIINIRHTEHPDSIILKVSIHRSDSASDIVLVPDTSIPIDRCSCPSVTCVTTNPSDGSDGTNPSHGTNPSDGSKPVIIVDPTAVAGRQTSLVVKIVVPFGVMVLLLIGIIIVLVIVGVVYSKKKRTRAYTFHRMAFNNNDVGEEEEEG